MRITYSLFLPRDELTVPVTRHIVRQSLEEIGIEGDCIHAVELALAEACTNVLKHSAADDEYEVSVEVDDLRCIIRVVDTGRGFDSEGLVGRPDPSAEAGRGFELMQALVDNVQLTSRPERGTIVHLEKELVLVDDSVLRQLKARNPSGDGTAGMATAGAGYRAGMADPDPEQRTQEEIRHQADAEPPDATTAREGVEQALAEEGRSDEGTTLGEHVD